MIPRAAFHGCFSRLDISTVFKRVTLDNVMIGVVAGLTCSEIQGRGDRQWNDFEMIGLLDQRWPRAKQTTTVTTTIPIIATETVAAVVSCQYIYIKINISSISQPKVRWCQSARWSMTNQLSDALPVTPTPVAFTFSFWSFSKNYKSANELFSQITHSLTYWAPGCHGNAIVISQLRGINKLMHKGDYLIYTQPPPPHSLLCCLLHSCEFRKRWQMYFCCCCHYNN